MLEGQRRGAFVIQKERSHAYLHLPRQVKEEAVKGMLAKTENREEAVANLFKSCGGKLIAWYLTFGHHDWLVVGEFLDEKSAALLYWLLPLAAVCPTLRQRWP
jgi:uncharacterized protein with GYD domain